MLKMNNKGFAISTILYGIISLIILLLMVIFATMKGTKSINNLFVAETEKSLNNCVTEEIALEKCYTNHSPSCSHNAYLTCLGLSDELNDPSANFPTIIDKLRPLAVTTGNGLYADSYEAGRYVFKGSNVSNYIRYDGRIWRIIAVESDGTTKIMLDTSIGDLPWDKLDKNDWASSSLNNKLSQEFYSGIADISKLTKRAYNVGRIYEQGSMSLTGIIEQEKMEQYMGTSASTGIVGLISLSDFAKASVNTSCQNIVLNNNLCTSYLTTGDMWRINGFVGSDSSVDKAIIVRTSATDASNYLVKNVMKVKPVVYLSSSVTIKSGNGSSSAQPYIID